MNSHRRFWAPVVFAVLTLFLFAGLVQAHVRAGWIAVHVQDEDLDLDLYLPSALARLALAFVPDEVWMDVRSEIGELAPLVREACRELDGASDAELVRVESRDETVSIAKRGGRVEIRVSAPGEEIDVRVPTRLIRAVSDKIAVTT